MLRVFVIALLLLVVAGIGFVAIWEMPAPMAPVEKVVPNDRFYR